MVQFVVAGPLPASMRTGGATISSFSASPRVVDRYARLKVKRPAPQHGRGEA